MKFDTFQLDNPPEPEHQVEAMDPRAMTVVRGMHRVAQQHDIVLACARCHQPFQGMNSPLDSTHSILCGCRELRAEAPQAKAVLN
jgi:hypothetical protein